jgi:hypothetical protein
MLEFFLGLSHGLFDLFQNLGSLFVLKPTMEHPKVEQFLLEPSKVIPF